MPRKRVFRSLVISGPEGSQIAAPGSASELSRTLTASAASLWITLTKGGRRSGSRLRTVLHTNVMLHLLALADVRPSLAVVGNIVAM